MAKSSQTPGSVLVSLMTRYELNPYALAKEIKLSYSAVRQIVSGKSKVSVPTAFRLAKYFDTKTTYWLDLQRDADICEAEKDKKLAAVLKGISKAKAGARPAKKAALSDKRKRAAKVPGAKPASRKAKRK